MEWREAKLRKYKHLTGPLSNLDRDGDAFKSTKAAMDRFVALAFPNGITIRANGTRPLQVWESMNDAMRAITCKPIGDTKLCPYKCCLQRCGDCTNELPVFSGETCVDGEHDDSTNFITWRQHYNLYECYVHGPIGRTTKCAQCAALPVGRRAKKDPKSTLKRQVQRQPIGIFIRDFYSKFIVEKHRQHYWLKNI
jgi:hypothetical protein